MLASHEAHKRDRHDRAAVAEHVKRTRVFRAATWARSEWFEQWQHATIVRDERAAAGAL